MKAQAARDTFLHYLADNLTGLKVTYIRFEAKKPNVSKLTTNAVNVKFLKDRLGVNISKLTLSIDVIFDDELDALDAVDKIGELLHASAYTQKLDYTDPAAPAPQGTNLYWEPNSVLFTQVVTAELYSHLSCTLVVTYN